MVSSPWLLLLYALPTKRTSARVNLWRKLKKFGAVSLKTSAYVLPDNPAHYERFQWLARQIKDDGGDATLIRVAEIEGLRDEQVKQLFNQARAADYKDLKATIQRSLAQSKKSKRATMPGELEKFQRCFNEIKEIDYFKSPAAHDAQTALQRAEKLLLPRKKSAAASVLDAKKFQNKVWLTRPRPGIDRAGSAWLIRKFIDPKAKFVFGMDPKTFPGALPYDMADVEFSHHADDCTFETLVKRFAINDKAVLQMAEMVHDADLEDGKFQRSECIGLNCVLTGWARTDIRDSDLLAKGTDCFEGLYQQLQK